MNQGGVIVTPDDYVFNDYTCGKVVFQPKLLTPDQLQSLYYYAWDKFYEEEPQNYKMFKLLKQVMEKEKLDGTYKQRVRQ
jgi:hypothetical protein